MSFVSFFSPSRMGYFCWIKNLFRRIFFLNDFINGIWELICCLSQQKLLLLLPWHLSQISKIIKPPFACIKLSSFRSSTFSCFKLAYNDFAFSWIIVYKYAFLKAFLHPHKLHFQYKRKECFTTSVRCSHLLA